MSTRNFSRREFIGMSSLAGLGLALSNVPLLAQSPAATKIGGGALATSKKFKMGIIGCGNRSRAIIGALNSVPEIEMTAFCDLVPNKAQARAAECIKNGAKPRFFTDMNEMLKMSELDCIAVITPSDTHKDIVIAALDAGKHVFCEKPMALTVADCNEMINVNKRSGKALQFGTQRRHSPEYKALIEAIRTKPVGKILQSSLFDFRGDWRVPAPDEFPAGTPYWRLDQKRSGGVVFEMGAHIIDVNNWVFDSEPVSVCSLQGVNNFTLRKRDSSDHAGVVVEYANGAMMNYGGNVYNYGSQALDTFFGENATLQMGNGMLSIKYGFPPGFPKPKDLPKAEQISLVGNNREGDGVVEELQYFAQVMDGKQKPYPDGSIARQAVQVMEGANRSAQERRVIDVKELG